jgi:PiT family inorganic phosphate transporter
VVLFTLWFLVGFALLFDFLNGMHDAANSIATIVSTRVLSPRLAVIWAAGFNFIAFLFFGLHVANTVGSGIVSVHIVTDRVIFGALGGAIVWNIVTWLFGIPSSSSHALVGGLVGAGLAKAGTKAIVWQGVGKTAAGIVVSASLYSLGHGGNDAQKTMGIIAVLLYVHAGGQGQFHVPLWVVLACQTAMALGTLSGGWRIVHTMGSKITRLTPMQGFCAETGGAITLFAATYLGIPVSTTHTITGAIIGVGAARRTSAVRWGVARGIVTAWVITMPAAGLVAAALYAVSGWAFP